MPRYRRPHVPGATVFFTVALAERGSRPLVEEVDRLREAVRATRAERPFGVEAWVVLPDHMRCVWRLPEGDADYATRWRLIETRFSTGLPTGRVRASHVARAERGVWQRRYWERHIRDEAALRAAVEHCRTNPVRHGFVARPEDWPWSSRAGVSVGCMLARTGAGWWGAWGWQVDGACEHAPYGFRERLGLVVQMCP